MNIVTKFFILLIDIYKNINDINNNYKNRRKHIFNNLFQIDILIRF